MARPNESGLSYYSIDTNIFQDRKIRRLLREFGSDGWLIYLYILTEIYRDKGCFIEWDKNSSFDVSDCVNVTENLVERVVDFCCEVGLFSKDLLDNERVLTSKSIQTRWEKISKDARRKINSIKQINSKYSLMQETTEITPTLIKLITEVTPQSKVKESKGKKSKEISCLHTAREEVFENLKTPEFLIEEIEEEETNSNNKFDNFISKFEKEFVQTKRYQDIGMGLTLSEITLRNYFSEFIAENKLSRKMQTFMHYQGFYLEISNYFFNWINKKHKPNITNHNENSKRADRILKSLTNGR